MYTISINHKDRGRKDYPVYKQAEADAEGIQYVSWRKANTGEMAISDDGYVSEVVTRKTYHDTKRKETARDYIRMAWGYIFYRPQSSVKFNLAGFKNRYTLGGLGRTEAWCNRPDALLLAKVMARLGNRKAAIKRVFSDTLSKGDYFSVNTKMKSKYFKANVKKEIEKLLTQHGFTEDFTMELLKRTIDLAEEKKDVGGLLRAVDNLQDLHGMKEKQQRVNTQQTEMRRTKSLIDSIGEVEENLKLKEVSVKPVDG